MFAITQRAIPVITKIPTQRILQKASHFPASTSPHALCKNTFSTSQRPPMQNILISNTHTCAMPQEYRGSGEIFIHGSTTDDLANIRDNGIDGRLYLMQLSSYPPSTDRDHQSLSDAIGYATYAAQGKATPAVGVFELMQHKNTPDTSVICLDDYRGTLYFQTAQGKAVLRLITVIDHKKHPLELPKEGYRTRREGSSSMWMSLGWYGPMFVGVCVLDHVVDAIKASIQ